MNRVFLNGKSMKELFRGCFMILLVVICLSKYAYLYELLPYPVACGGVVLLVALLLIFLRAWNKGMALGKQFLDQIAKRISPEMMAIILAIGSLLTKLVVIRVLNIDSLIHPDIDVYVTTARELSECGIAKAYAGYCYSYSHMFWFSVFLMPIVHVFGDSHVVLSIYMAFVSTLSLLLIFDTARYNFSYQKAIVIGWIGCILPSQMLLPGYITHEHALTLFLSISIWLNYRVLPCVSSKFVRIGIQALIWFNLFLGSQINAAGIVALIAFCICNLMMVPRSKIGHVMFVISFLSIVLLGGIVFEYIQLKHSEVSDGYVKSGKINWTLYVGSREEEGWFQEAGRRYADYPSNSSLDEIRAYRYDLLKEEYKMLLSDPGKIVQLLKAKLIKIWACFTYPIGYANETITNPALRGIYNRILFKPLVLVEYGMGIILLYIGMVSIWMNKKVKGLLLFLELYMLGVTAMLLLTECNNKYTISLQYIFVMACLSFVESKKELIRK